MRLVSFLTAVFLIIGVAHADVVAPGLSDRSYRGLALENQMKVLLIADPTTDKAAASLDVYVGTNDDPAEFPGLAHFLEHMLFLGTDRFPEAGEYQQFISTQGGSHNAYTSPEHTNYFFDVDPAGLAGALDRFSRFFIAPTLDPVYVEREVNAVHSEYQSKLKDEARRGFEATKQGLNPAHPFSGFGAGNLETLNKPGLLEALNRFYVDEYSADRMALVVLGRDDLDTLESMVRARFADVPNRNLGVGVVSEPLFDLSRLPIVVQSQPVSESRRLSLLFPVPDTDAFAGNAPLPYIGHLLGHEGEGSLLQWLKTEGLANGLSAGEGLGMTESRSFSISVSLTPKGFAERDRVIARIFETLALIETAGLDAWRFDELKVMADADFRFSEESSPQGLVTQLADRLHTIPAREVFTRGRLLDQFNPDIVRDILGWLTPDRMLLRVTAPEVEPDATTAYYPTEIRVFPLEKERQAMWQQARRTPSTVVSLPQPNPFIKDPGAPLVANRVATVDTRPHLAINTPAAIGFVLPETRFSQPKSDLFIRLRTPLASNSPEASIMAELLASAINEEFNPLSYEALLAGVQFSAQATQSGITLSFSGYHQPMRSLVETVMSRIPVPLLSAVTWERLSRLKQQELDAIDSTRPVNRLFGELTAGLMPLAYPKEELREVFASIDLGTFHEYQKAFFSGLKAELFLHGPVSQDVGETLLTEWMQALPLDPNTADVTPTTEPWKGARDRSFTYAHPDQAAVVAFDQATTDAGSRALNTLAGSLIEAPFYTALRTEQQLGYITFATAFPLINTPILAGVIQSPVASPDALVEAIQGQFNGFADWVAALPSEQFEMAKQALINELESPPQNQDELSGQIWQAIGLGRPFTDRLQQSEVLKRIDQSAFVEYLRSRIANPIVLRGNGQSS